MEGLGGLWSLLEDSDPNEVTSRKISSEIVAAGLSGEFEGDVHGDNYRFRIKFDAGGRVERQVASYLVEDEFLREAVEEIIGEEYDGIRVEDSSSGTDIVLPVERRYEGSLEDVDFVAREDSVEFVSAENVELIEKPPEASPEEFYSHIEEAIGGRVEGYHETAVECQSLVQQLSRNIEFGSGGSALDTVITASPEPELSPEDSRVRSNVIDYLGQNNAQLERDELVRVPSKGSSRELEYNPRTSRIDLSDLIRAAEFVAEGEVTYGESSTSPDYVTFQQRRETLSN